VKESAPPALFLLCGDTGWTHAPGKIYWQMRQGMQDKPGIIFDQLLPVVEGMGYRLVDAHGATVKGTLKVNCIVFSEKGITTGDCEAVSRAIHPRLEVLYNTQDLSLEVSSPGLERKFSSLHEFAVFDGKLVKVYVEGKDWVTGTISTVGDEVIELVTETEGKVSIPRQNIHKAQLVYQEVR
jgi:ribosome maturation factor RimP